VSRAGFRDAWGAWAGLVVAPLAWLAHHQIGGDLNFADCSRGRPVVLIAIGVAMLAVTVAATVISLLAWRRSGREGSAAGFIPVLSIMAGGLFGLTILVQILAAAILPPCFR
jgi:hypothetical protein